MESKIKLKIAVAGIVIQMQSKFSLEQPSEKEKRHKHSERFHNFFYSGEKSPHVLIEVQIVDKLPEIYDAKPLFITYHFQDGRENWRLLKKAESYIYKSPLEDKKQLMLVNQTFDRVTAYLLPKKDKGRVWTVNDIIYDFLQVLLINYFAQRKEGIFTHAVGLKDINGRGMLFAGKSGAGKSTTARLWHKHSKAMVLNDDRIIVRKAMGRFFIHGSPWHGEFSDYLDSRIESAPLQKLFFIHHAPKNTARRLSQKEAFCILYPALFAAFWDKPCLENIVSFCEDLLANVPCYSLGFVNNQRIIDFVRRLNERNTIPGF